MGALTRAAHGGGAGVQGDGDGGIGALTRPSHGGGAWGQTGGGVWVG